MVLQLDHTILGLVVILGTICGHVHCTYFEKVDYSRVHLWGTHYSKLVFTIVWFTIFGNTAIYIDETVANGALGALTDKPEQLLFAFLEYLPLSGLTSLLSIIVLALFFITSADSGIYVLNNIAAYDKSTSSPKWQCLMWGSVMSFLAISLLSIGGLNVLQSVTLILAFTILQP